MPMNQKKIDIWVKHKKVDKLLTAAYKSNDAHELREIINGLGKVQTQESAEGLVPFLLHKENSINDATQNALIKIGSAAVRPIEPAIWDENYIEKQRETWALSQYITPYTDHFNLQKRCVEALSKIREQECIDPLLRVLETFYPALILRPVVKAMGELREKRAIPALIRIFDRDPKYDDDGLRWDTANALGQIGDAEAVPVLIKVLLDPEEGVRVRDAAAEALGKIGDSKAVDALCEAVRDIHVLYNETEYLINKTAATALGWIGDSRALETLKAASENNEMFWLVGPAKTAIKSINFKIERGKIIKCSGCGREKPYTEWICSECGYTDIPYGTWENKIGGYTSTILLEEDGQFIWTISGVPASEGHNQGKFTMSIEDPKKPESLTINVAYDNGSFRSFRVRRLVKNEMDWISMDSEQALFCLTRIERD